MAPVRKGETTRQCHAWSQATAANYDTGLKRQRVNGIGLRVQRPVCLLARLFSGVIGYHDVT